MSLPSIAKTYQYNVNAQIPAQASTIATSQKIWRQIVTTLLGFASNPWTVDYSCDATTAGTKGDAVNRWSADNKLNWSRSGSTGKSWMVLKNDNIATGFELLICCESDPANSTNNGYGITIVVSYGAGFTGGTTTARPTATDQKILCDNSGSLSSGPWTYLVSNSTAIFSSVLHVWHSTDGKATRIVLCVSNATSCFSLFMEKANPQISAWASPAIAVWTASQFGSAPGVAATTESITYANMVRATRAHSRLTDNFSMMMTVEGCNASTVGEQQTFTDDDSQEWPICPVGLYSTTAGHRGRKGLVIDFWMGSTQVNTGDTYPDDATKQFVQLGHGIFPWNGTTPIIA